MRNKTSVSTETASGTVGHLPTTCRATLAVSSTFSICTWRSYFPECFFSVLRMKRMVSPSLVLTLANVELRGSPFLLHVTFGLGFP